MRVFLTGATGYIGSVVAEVLQREGHSVIGLARSDEAARKLEARGVAVRRGDLRDTGTLAAAAGDAGGVIHTGLDLGAADTPAVDAAAVAAMLEALHETGRPFIYTSGVWVLGDTGGRVADEDTPVNPTPLVAWRPAVERTVLDAARNGVRSVVIRPAMVYGRGGGAVGDFVRTARQTGAVRYVGDGSNRWSFVHVDDLAELYFLALTQSPEGYVYLAAAGEAIPVKTLAEAASRAAGAEGRVQAVPLEQARETMGLFADALVLDQQISGDRAKRLLGWKPRRPSVLEELAGGAWAG